MNEHDDTHFGMKKLALNNWTIPDVPKFFSITEESWLAQVMAPQFIEAVPEEIKRLFEVARGSIVYGWFFYPLLTLASEQIYRVEEAAFKARCKQVGMKMEHPPKRDGRVTSKKFWELIKELHKDGFIDDDSKDSWTQVRNARNHTSHPEHQSINVPSAATACVHVAVRRINHLFADNPEFYTRLGERVRRAIGTDRIGLTYPPVVGIVVGIPNGEFHLVAMKSVVVLDVATVKVAAEAVAFCLKNNAELVAVNAPCGWRIEGQTGREAERFLAYYGVYTIGLTPTRGEAQDSEEHAWLLKGEALYAALSTEYPLYSRDNDAAKRLCFEVSPPAAVRAFCSFTEHAQRPNPNRLQLLRAAGIDVTSLATPEFSEAAICALVANCVSVDYCSSMGDSAGGFIICPGGI